MRDTYSRPGGVLVVASTTLPNGNEYGRHLYFSDDPARGTWIEFGCNALVEQHLARFATDSNFAPLGALVPRVRHRYADPTARDRPPYPPTDRERGHRRSDRRHRGARDAAALLALMRFTTRPCVAAQDGILTTHDALPASPLAPRSRSSSR